MQSNRDIVVAVFAETAKGNGRAFSEAMADDMTWRIIGATYWSGTFSGREAIVRDLLKPLGQRLGGRNVCRPTRILADGDHVVVQACGENTTVEGKAYRNDYCFVLRMENGRMAALEEYSDTQLIVDALGEKPGAG